MEKVKQLLDSGDLTGAIAAALDVVRSEPTNIAARIFLFELSLFSGDWDRADKQMDVIGHQDAQAALGSLIFRQCLSAEKDRLKFYSDGLKPGILAPPPIYIEDMLNANNRIREGNIAEAREILDRVEEERPAFTCTLNGESVEDIRDYNDATMCLFEVIFKDSYTWLPFENVSKVTFFEPKSLRDLYWRQAQVEMTNGTNGEMFFPTLYVGSAQSSDDAVRLGHATEWQDLGDELYRGLGCRTYFAQGRDISILELKTVEFDHSDENE
jgi:type VI secretion system protein ImpE